MPATAHLYPESMMLREGTPLPTFKFAGASETTWSTDNHRKHDVPLVLILHRHLA
jgi:hypothetical protein